MADQVIAPDATDCILPPSLDDVEPLSEDDSMLLPTKFVPTPSRRPRDAPLHLAVTEAESGAEDRASHMPPLMTMTATETSYPAASTGAVRQRRHLSLTCVPLEIMARSTRSLPSRKMMGRYNVNRVAALLPPNEASTPAAAVRDHFSFVLDHCIQTSADLEVELHVYDLSHGYLKRFAQELVGMDSPGVYHSAVVCYGLEFYFEGGIGIASAGRTRFGAQYRKHRIGVTGKSVTQFLHWVGLRGLHVNQVHDYHAVRHNCHHFSNEAVQFLIGAEASIPQYLFDTVDQLARTPVGAAVMEALTLVTRGLQSSVCRQLLSRVRERQGSVDMQLSAAVACGIMRLPPTAAVLFRAADADLAKRFLLGLLPFVKNLISRQLLKPAAVEVLEDAAEALASGFDTIPPKLILNYVEMVVEALGHSPMTVWTPILNSLRVAVLHKSCLITCVFHPKLLPVLVLAARDFPRLLPDGRLALLRLLCNFACSTHGAVVYTDSRYRDSWVAVVGLGLMEKSAAVVYTAACLAQNLSLMIVIVTNPSLRRSMCELGHDHYALRLMTLLLYNLRFRTSKELPEPSFNMALLALYRLTSSNSAALDHVQFHAFKPRYADLLERCESNESRALVCLIQTLEDLFGGLH